MLVGAALRCLGFLAVGLLELSLVVHCLLLVFLLLPLTGCGLNGLLGNIHGCSCKSTVTVQPHLCYTPSRFLVVFDRDLVQGLL